MNIPSLRSAASLRRQTPRSHGVKPNASSGSHARRVERRRERRERLRRRRALAWHVGRRHRRAPRPDGAARRSRGRAGTGAPPSWPGGARARRARRRALEERGLARDVVVPEIVVHGLEVPDDAPAGAVEGDDRAPVVVDARALAPEEVRARVARRHEEQVALRVGGEGRPGVRACRGASAARRTAPRAAVACPAARGRRPRPARRSARRRRAPRRPARRGAGCRAPGRRQPPGRRSASAAR